MQTKKVTDDMKLAFLDALKNDDHESVEQLLIEGCSPNLLFKEPGHIVYLEKNPIHIAKSPRMIQLLLDFGADPNQHIYYNEVMDRTYQTSIFSRVQGHFYKNQPYYSENIISLLSYQPFLINTNEINRTLIYIIRSIKKDTALKPYQLMLIRSSADLTKKVQYKKEKVSPLEFAEIKQLTAWLNAMVSHNFPLQYQISTGHFNPRISINSKEVYQQSEAAELLHVLAIWPLISMLYQDIAFPKELLDHIKTFVIALMSLQYPADYPFIFKYLDLEALMPIFKNVYHLLDNKRFHLHLRKSKLPDSSPIFFEKVLESAEAKKPNGRTGFAWQLTKKYRHQAVPENLPFMQNINSWFKQKKRFKKGAMTQQEKAPTITSLSSS